MDNTPANDQPALTSNSPPVETGAVMIGRDGVSPHSHSRAPAASVAVAQDEPLKTQPSATADGPRAQTGNVFVDDLESEQALAGATAADLASSENLAAEAPDAEFFAAPKVAAPQAITLNADLWREILKAKVTKLKMEVDDIHAMLDLLD